MVCLREVMNSKNHFPFSFRTSASWSKGKTLTQESSISKVWLGTSWLMGFGHGSSTFGTGFPHQENGLGLSTGLPVLYGPSPYLHKPLHRRNCTHIHRQAMPHARPCLWTFQWLWCFANHLKVTFIAWKFWKCTVRVVWLACKGSRAFFFFLLFFFFF